MITRMPLYACILFLAASDSSKSISCVFEDGQSPFLPVPTGDAHNSQKFVYFRSLDFFCKSRVNVFLTEIEKGSDSAVRQALRPIVVLDNAANVLDDSRIQVSHGRYTLLVWMSVSKRMISLYPQLLMFNSSLTWMISSSPNPSIYDASSKAKNKARNAGSVQCYSL